jgi:putative iron-dependent peroxidase
LSVGAELRPAQTCRTHSVEPGTYFIGYGREPDLIEQMLRNMFVGKPPGNYDRILDFSTAVTGSLFFVPSAAFLDDPGGSGTPPLSRAHDQTSADGSPGIGGLKDTRGDSASGSADRL